MPTKTVARSTGSNKVKTPKTTKATPSKEAQSRKTPARTPRQAKAPEHLLDAVHHAAVVQAVSSWTVVRLLKAVAEFGCSPAPASARKPMLVQHVVACVEAHIGVACATVLTGRAGVRRDMAILLDENAPGWRKACGPKAASTAAIAVREARVMTAAMGPAAQAALVEANPTLPASRSAASKIVRSILAVTRVVTSTVAAGARGALGAAQLACKAAALLGPVGNAGCLLAFRRLVKKACSAPGGEATCKLLRTTLLALAGPENSLSRSVADWALWAVGITETKTPLRDVVSAAESAAVQVNIEASAMEAVTAQAVAAAQGPARVALEEQAERVAELVAQAEVLFEAPSTGNLRGTRRRTAEETITAAKDIHDALKMAAGTGRRSWWPW
jgi:hypothetical protein